MRTYLDDHAVRAAAGIGPGVQASITVRHHGATVRVASSDGRAAACDQVEARTEDGPCIIAMSGLDPVVVPDVGQEWRWPTWSRTVLDSGFASVAAVPAPVDRTVAVAVNVYAEPGVSWDPPRLEAGRGAAEAVAVDVRARLRAAVLAEPPMNDTDSEPAIIDRAVGVIMQGNGCDAPTARALLTMVAFRDKRPLVDVAAFLLATVSHPR